MTTTIPSQFQKVGVLMGGLSAEREISLKSGQAVLKALLDSGINAVAIDLQQDWPSLIKQHKIDAAFITLHGTKGEDGCIQGLLEVMKIPYTGSSIMASSLCMNKPVTKQVLNSAGLKTPIDIPIQSSGPIRYPVFIKPAQEGSSVGLHLISQPQEWLELAITSAQEWMAEMPVKGVEVAVSVLDGTAFMPIEIHPKSGIYDFASKYTLGATEYFCPARLPAESLRLCMQQAELAVKVTQCQGAPRVDMIVSDGGTPIILEINTIPGMTETSLLPKAAQASGLSFNTLCLRILASASLQHQDVVA
ncbi:MAG: D-alanine--D-alanine ligase [Mariprofundaceae bacterium]